MLLNLSVNHNTLCGNLDSLSLTDCSLHYATSTVAPAKLVLQHNPDPSQLLTPEKVKIIKQGAFGFLWSTYLSLPQYISCLRKVLIGPIPFFFLLKRPDIFYNLNLSLNPRQAPGGVPVPYDVFLSSPTLWCCSATSRLPTDILTPDLLLWFPTSS